MTDEKSMLIIEMCVNDITIPQPVCEYNMTLIIINKVVVTSCIIIIE